MGCGSSRNKGLPSDLIPKDIVSFCSSTETGDILVYTRELNLLKKLVAVHEKCVNCLIQLKLGAIHNLVSGGDDERIRIWDIPRTTCKMVLRATDQKISFLLELRSGLLAGSGGSSVFAGVFIWEIHTGGLLMRIAADRSVLDVKCVFEISEDWVLLESEIGSVSCWDVSTGRQRYQIDNTGYSVRGILNIGDPLTPLPPEELCFISEEGVKPIKIFTHREPTQYDLGYSLEERTTNPPSYISAFALLCDGNTLTTGSTLGVLKQWNIRGSRTSIREWNYPTLGKIYSIIALRGGKILLACALQGILLFDMKKGKIIRKVRGGDASGCGCGVTVCLLPLVT